MPMTHDMPAMADKVRCLYYAERRTALVEDYADSVGQALLNVSRVTSRYAGPFSRNSGLGLLTNPSFAQSFDAFLLSG